MSKRFKSFFMIVTALVLSIFIIPQANVFADIADGTYEVNYEMKEAGNDNTSIADGYFESPATLTVENGTQYIELTVTGADMIKSLSAPSGPVDVVSESGDTRTVKFKVDGDLSQPVDMEMHIVVPDLYDTTHTARAVFDVSGLESADNGEDESTTENDNSNVDKDDETTVAGDNNDSGSGKAEDNPPTGDNSSIVLYAVLFIGSAVALFAVRKLRPAQD